MKQRFLIAISSLLVLTGCGSSEMSPEEKRNKFDKCVLDYIEDSENGGAYHPNSESREKAGKLECKDLLD